MYVFNQINLSWKHGYKNKWTWADLTITQKCHKESICISYNDFNASIKMLLFSPHKIQNNVSYFIEVLIFGHLNIV